jgi:threonylcarbamoyladenosine tRNA methylthiotransferase MtaB
MVASKALNHDVLDMADTIDTSEETLYSEVSHDATLPYRVAFTTLGCKANQLESSALAKQFRTLGWQVVAMESGRADLIVFNTCTVTERADAENRRMIRLAHKKNPHAKLAVTGCYAQVNPEAVAAMAGVHFVIGNHLKEQLASLLVQELPHLKPSKATEAALPGQWPKIWVSDWDKSREQATLEGMAEAVGGAAGLNDEGYHRTRASLKIQDGCDYKCTYCIIWQGRGPSRSVPIALLKQKVLDLVHEGFKEIVLTGINIGQYAFETHTLTSLLRALVNLDTPHMFRLRLSSLDPLELTPELIDLIAEEAQKPHGRIAPHFHLSAQSCSDTVLKAMARRHHVGAYCESVHRIRQAMPQACIVSDIIVGFPTETDAHFEETLEVLTHTAPLDQLHVFRYSPRPGTPAATMKPQVPERIRKERASKLLQLSQTHYKAFVNKQAHHYTHAQHPMRILLEKPVDVLPELLCTNTPTHDSGFWLEGLSDTYTRIWVWIPDTMPHESDVTSVLNTWAWIEPQEVLLPHMMEETGTTSPILLGKLLYLNDLTL